jgi:hypothetical protein
VDLLIDDHTAVEFKTGTITQHDARGLLALEEELPLKHKWIVGLEKLPRMLDHGVEVLPWATYIERINHF